MHRLTSFLLEATWIDCNTPWSCCIHPFIMFSLSCIVSLSSMVLYRGFRAGKKGGWAGFFEVSSYMAGRSVKLFWTSGTNEQSVRLLIRVFLPAKLWETLLRSMECIERVLWLPLSLVGFSLKYLLAPSCSGMFMSIERCLSFMEGTAWKSITAITKAINNKYVVMNYWD